MGHHSTGELQDCISRQHATTAMKAYVVTHGNPTRAPSELPYLRLAVDRDGTHWCWLGKPEWRGCVLLSRAAPCGQSGNKEPDAGRFDPDVRFRVRVFRQAAAGSETWQHGSLPCTAVRGCSMCSRWVVGFRIGSFIRAKSTMFYDSFSRICFYQKSATEHQIMSSTSWKLDEVGLFHGSFV